jgi:type IV pilus assembly protein PilO
MGSYRELAMFVSDISGLPRIVTIHDIKLTPYEDAKKAAEKEKVVNLGTAVIEDTQRLRMEAVIKTYRYLEDSVKKKNEQLAKTDKKNS